VKRAAPGGWVKARCGFASIRRETDARKLPCVENKELFGFVWTIFYGPLVPSGQTRRQPAREQNCWLLCLAEGGKNLELLADYWMPMIRRNSRIIEPTSHRFCAHSFARPRRRHAAANSSTSSCSKVSRGLMSRWRFERNNPKFRSSSSSRNCTLRAKMPCFKLLELDLRFPSAVMGPVDCWASGSRATRLR
jgi:hypothetical protein